MPINNATLLRINTEYRFLMGNCNAAASASNYAEFSVFLLPTNSINNQTSSFTQINTKPLPLPKTWAILWSELMHPKYTWQQTDTSHLGLPDTAEQQKEASAQRGNHCTGSEYLNLSQGIKQAFFTTMFSGEDLKVMRNKLNLKWNLNQESNLKFTLHRHKSFLALPLSTVRHKVH